MIVREYDTIFSSGEDFARVCVVIPLYNYAHTIRETLETVKSQEIDEVSLVIVDDKSTDDSLATALAWCEENHTALRSVRLISNTTNGGLSISRNTGAVVALSEYIFFLDADNTIYPRCLHRLREALDASDAAFAFSSMEVFGERRGVIGTRVFNSDLLAWGNYIDAMALIRKSVLEAAGGYKVMPYGWEDYELWLTFAERGQHGIQVPELLGRYRAHGTSMTHTTTAVNVEKLKRQIQALHPWVQVPLVPDFMPGSAAATWSRLKRYGGMAGRQVSARLGDRADLSNFARHLVRTWRTRGGRAAAEELRLLDNVSRANPARRLPQDVKWLPRFVDENVERRAALLPFALPVLPETPHRGRIGVFAYLSGLEDVEWLADILQAVPEVEAVHVALADGVRKDGLRNRLGQAGARRVEIAAIGERNAGPFAALAAFGDRLTGFDYLAVVHGDRSDQGADAAQRRILFSHTNVQSILAALWEDASIGIVDAAVPAAAYAYAAVSDDARRWVIAKSGLRIDPALPADRPGGSMFWARPAALRSLMRVPPPGPKGPATEAAKLESLYLACEDAGFNRLTVCEDAQAAGYAVWAVKSLTDLSAVISGHS